MMRQAIKATFVNDGRAEAPSGVAHFINDLRYGGPHSVEDIRNDLQREVAESDIFGGGDGDTPMQSPASPFPYVRDIIVPRNLSDPWTAIVMSGNRMFKVQFTIGDDGEPDLVDSDPVEVEADTVYNPVTAPETNPLPESSNSYLTESQYSQPVAGYVAAPRTSPAELKAFANCRGVSQAVWNRAKAAVGRSHDEDDEAFWPEVQKVAQNLS